MTVRKVVHRSDALQICSYKLAKQAGYQTSRTNMADKTPKRSDAQFATRIDPSKEELSREQLHFIKQVELEQWRKKTQKMRARNVLTGVAIGAVVLGICILLLMLNANVNTR